MKAPRATVGQVPATLVAMSATRTRRSLAATLVGCLLLVGSCARSSASPSTSESPSGSASAAVTASEIPSPGGSPQASLPVPTLEPLPTGPDRVRLDLVASGLADPIGITNAGDGSGRLFVNERGGRVRVITADGTLLPAAFVDLSSRISAGGERGLLGLAFHPHFAQNGRLFVDYTRAGDGATVISELEAAGDFGSASAASERVLLTIAQPFANHNGGQVAFGPDGYLYIGMGDGGSGGDPFGNGQNTNALLGKILRIDVDRRDGGLAYAIPVDNPFAVRGSRPGEGAAEVWAYGLRNPWRFSFDPSGGDLYIGDVGQGRYEEIDRQPGDAAGGDNYGWSVMEGRHCYQADCDQAGYVKPIAEYSHDLGCAVTGGYVYRGSLYPELAGVYLFADYCAGTLFSLQVDEGTITPKPVLDSGHQVSAFGTDEAGEIYLADIGGGAVYRVRPD
jgi:glucose/arabinose dehydrogenase